MNAPVSTPAAIAPGMGDLSEQYHHVIEAMEQGLQLHTIAHQLQVSLATLYSWFTEPQFNTMLQQRRIYLIEYARLKLYQPSAEMVDRLIELTESANLSIRLRAINTFLRLVKVDRNPSTPARAAQASTPSVDALIAFQPRIDALEASAAANKTPPATEPDHPADAPAPSEPAPPTTSTATDMPAPSEPTPSEPVPPATSATDAHTHDPFVLADEPPLLSDMQGPGKAAPMTRGGPEPEQPNRNRRERRKQHKKQQKRKMRR